MYHGVRPMEPHRPRRARRLVVTFLTGVLVAFSAWSVWLLARAQPLRDELDRSFGWLEEVSAARAELERRRDFSAGEPLADLGAFRLRTERLSRQIEDPGLRLALQQLQLALDPLVEAGEDADADTLWQASVAALAAADAFEARIRAQVARLHRDLAGHWRSLWLLVPGVLVLAASNLVLLFAVDRRRRELEGAHAQAMSSARHDPLTGLWNREGIVRLLDHELVRAGRSQAPLGVILADVDDFKAVNDLLGFDQGDFVLEQIGKRLQSMVRPYDTLGRFGGDSFLLVLPACDASATEQVARRLEKAVGEREVEHALGRIRVTLSLARTTVERARETDVDTVLRVLQEGVDESRTTIPRPD